MDLDTKEAIDKINGKLDGIVDAINRLTRIEERHDALAKIADRHEVWLQDHETRIRTAEISRVGASEKVTGNQRVTWWLMGLLSGAVLLIVKMAVGV